jgi:predicted O-methyltransferase YrrM
MFESIINYWKNWRLIRSEQHELRAIPKLPFDASRLRRITASEIRSIFTSTVFDQEWNQIADILSRHCDIADGQTGAVNPGDRRAIYYLIRGLHPLNLLEIGTHVGASTIHIAAAIAREKQNTQKIPTLMSVDIQDVNDAPEAPWRRFQLHRPPAGMLQDAGYSDFVRFITQKSPDFLRQHLQKYDFIFLDGSHAAAVVYQEIPLALASLEENGVILLHDFYPHNKPLWSSNRGIIPGPWIAFQRLLKEGAPLSVIPLGALPWPTKLGTNVTSLAILTRQ